MTQTYDSLDVYLNLAKKTISKFGPKFYNGLSTEMLKNNDAVSDVATAIMYADWRFDPERVGKEGKKKTLYSYRNQCAIWAIKTYISNKYKKSRDSSQPVVSLNFNMADSSEISATIKDNRCIDPIDILIEQEESNNLTNYISTILKSDILSDKQKSQLKMYYLESLTLSAIGKQFGVSREAVRQNIKRAIEIIKSYDKC
jgi:RNA polymerase sigma factor (sigma-70 family)